MKMFSEITHFAHRGLHDQNFVDSKVYENSKTAIQNAIANNIAIEVDLQLTKDNKLIVFHDETLLRLFNINQKVKDYTINQLKTMVYPNTNETILTFKELLNMVNGKVFLLIELKNKSLSQKIVPAFLDDIKHYPYPFAVKSFNWRTMQLIKKKNPTYLCGKLLEHFQFVPRLYNYFFGLFFQEDFISVNIEDYPLYKLNRAYHKPILTWTINSEKKLNKAQTFTHQLVFENYPKENTYVIKSTT